MAGVLVLLCVVLPLDSPHVSNLNVKIRMIFGTNTLKECLSALLLQVSSVTTYHSGDDKDDNKGKGGKEDDEDDVVGGEQGGGGEEVGVHLPHLVGGSSFMFHILCCLGNISQSNLFSFYDRGVSIDLNCHRQFSLFSLFSCFYLVDCFSFYC